MMKLEELKQELMETKNKCAEIEKKINELEKKASEVRWKAEKGDSYYYSYSSGEIVSAYDSCDSRATSQYNIGNYFRTREEAEKTIEKIKIYTQLKDLVLRLNKGEEIDWADEDQAKYCIYYDNHRKKIYTTCNYYSEELGQIYCLDENFSEKATQEIGEENLKKLFE